MQKKPEEVKSKAEPAKPKPVETNTVSVTIKEQPKPAKAIPEAPILNQADVKRKPKSKYFILNLSEK